VEERGSSAPAAPGAAASAPATVPQASAEAIPTPSAAEASASANNRPPVTPADASPATSTDTSPSTTEAIVADLDTQLMLRVRAGDQEAAAALVRRNLERVSRFVARIVRDSRHVEDIAQEIFLQVLSAAPRYQPTARFSTWLYRIATNAALDHLQQPYQRRRREAGDESWSRFADEAQPEPDQNLSLAELKNQINAAMANLPVNQRVALTLFEFEGLSYEQISAIMDVSVDGVRALLARARRTLRTELKGLL
jgi:RNA polymerase sigma-70 factor (ECF subfamily)